jgi:hypothetical protein
MTALKIELSEFSNGSTNEQEILDTIDFADWDFYPEQDDELKIALTNVVRRQISDGFRATLKNYWPPDIEFSTDGVNIMVSFNLGSNRNDGLIYFVGSIEDMIVDFIEQTNPEQMDGGSNARVELLKRLRTCISKLRTALLAQETAE